MTRWHEYSCESPEIEVGDDKVPKCIECGRFCPPVEELISKQAEISSAWQVPADQPLGEMNLWWPESVPYARGGVRVQIPPKPSIEQDTPADTTPKIPSSHIYQETLRSDQFRLACLYAVSDKDHPIHVTLEAYPDDEHPEYECASYTWGGEDGDSALCRPVYIGPYWDVLLQTKNCSSMLRFLRPWKGIRIMWVDAICINQESLAEKATQVAKMKYLYEMCSRVVVYLGEDIITYSKRFPTSRSLKTLGQAEPLFPPNHALQKSKHRYDLGDLLHRKYFTRLWIVQELVACPRAIIRVGDVNLDADASIMATNFLTNNRGFKLAPWFLHLGKGSLSGRSKDCKRRTSLDDMLSVLKLTSQSQASDIRDRLFGIVSLLPKSQLQWNFAPNYGISHQQFCIGFFSHLLLVGNKYWFLWYAGLGGTDTAQESTMPSWMPVCQSSFSWHNVMKATPTEDEDFQDHMGERFADGRIPQHEYFTLSSDSVYHENGISYHGDYPIQFDNHAEDSIDTTNGALIINVTHLFSFRDGISFQRAFGPLHVYHIRSVSRATGAGLSGSLPLGLLSMGPLEIQPENDHLFIADRISHTYLILRRQTDDTSSHKSFKLVTARIRLHELNRPEKPDLGEIRDQSFQDSENWARLWPLRRDDIERFIHTNVATALCVLKAKLLEWIDGKYNTHGDDRTERFCNFFLRQPLRYQFSHGNIVEFCSNIVPLWGAMSLDPEVRRDNVASKEAVHRALLQCIDPMLQARIVSAETPVDGWIIFTVPYDTWTSIHKQLFDTPTLVRNTLHWQWSYEGATSWHRNLQLPGSKFRTLLNKQSENIVVRVDLRWFLDKIWQLDRAARSVLCQLVHAYDPPLEINQVIQMIKDGPVEEHQHIGLPKYLGGVLVDGSQSRIRIV